MKSDFRTIERLKKELAQEQIEKVHVRVIWYETCLESKMSTKKASTKGQRMRAETWGKGKKDKQEDVKKYAANISAAL